MTSSDNARVASSYAAVRRISRQSGSNFYRSFWLLPRLQRDAMSALYAFARITDDLGDSNEPVMLRRHALNWWRQTTAMNLIGDASATIRLAEEVDEFSPAVAARLRARAGEIMPALRHASDHFSIPSRYLLEIIDGVLADQQKSRFDTFEQLEHYCYLVASAVGIACLHIWGFREPLPMQAAIDCGLAFQLTNILRDVSEDAARGRIYLPRQHFEQHGLDEDDLLHPRRDARLRCLILDETRRASELFDSGWRVWDSLEEPGRPMFSMMWRTYRALLQRIAEDPDAILSRRVSLGMKTRLGIVSSHFVGPLYRRLPVPPAEVGRDPRTPPLQAHS
ncbi:phytoene/squalene synthase family protein [Allorhodopirellula heiligendammensis]|uniref:All-trans-phytoene synthase n=1 Tax=Allorhodopirellula heiligendammensis TaxID=2714739 RepID=A0A5C6BWK9_9BACT|nr:phytoene/squalene synthase family protein [Allorhodopirellula heiligendammensis]TWU16017.1 All-trans-phytoene synthase [Allorhodopirellula heiligendammensis]